MQQAQRFLRSLDKTRKCATIHGVNPEKTEPWTGLGSFVLHIMPFRSDRQQRRRAHSHIRNLARLRRLPEKVPQLPALSDRSVIDAQLIEARRRRRLEKLERYGVENRDELTRGEQAMDAILREMGWRFNAEHPVGNYIIDFYVHEHKMAIEVDGGYHNTFVQKQRDRKRDRWLVSRGFLVARFTNEQVLKFPRRVKASIKALLQPQNTENIFPSVLPSQTFQERKQKAIQRRFEAHIINLPRIVGGARG